MKSFQTMLFHSVVWRDPSPKRSSNIYLSHSMFFIWVPVSIADLLSALRKIGSHDKHFYSVEHPHFGTPGRTDGWFDNTRLIDILRAARSQAPRLNSEWDSSWPREAIETVIIPVRNFRRHRYTGEGVREGGIKILRSVHDAYVHDAYVEKNRPIMRSQCGNWLIDFALSLLIFLRHYHHE